MPLRTILASWRAQLIQGVLMVATSVIIFNNPEGVLATLAFFLGAMVTVAGLIGIISYAASENDDRDAPSLLGHIAVLILGIVMISKLAVTMKTVSFLFGLWVAILSFLCVRASWNGRKQWDSWWVIGLLGTAAFFLGIRSMVNVYSGAQNISTLIGIPVLISGIALICLAFMKKKAVRKIEIRVTEFKEEVKARAQR